MGGAGRATSVCRSRLAAGTVCFSFVGYGVVVDVNRAIVCRTDLGSVVSYRYFLLGLFRAATIFHYFGRDFAGALRLRFRFRVFLCRLVIGHFRVGVSNGVVNYVVRDSQGGVDEYGRHAPLVAIRTRWWDGASCLRGSGRGPMIVLWGRVRRVFRWCRLFGILVYRYTGMLHCPCHVTLTG